MPNPIVGNGQWLAACEIASAIFLSAFSGHANATDWRMVIASTDVVMMVDAETVRRQKNQIAFRATAFPPAPDADGSIGSVGDITFDCKARLMKTERMFDIRPNGKTAANAGAKTGFVSIQKNSIGELFLDRMCGIKANANKIDGVFVGVPPPLAAKSVFGLLKLNLDSKQASELASQKYWDEESLMASLSNIEVPEETRQAARKVLAGQTVKAPLPPPPIVPLQSVIATGKVGKYTHSEPEMVAGLWLRADGTFRYGLTVGSLDETAVGRWTTTGNRVHLFNEPRPIPPTITAGPATLLRGAPITVSLRTAAGKPVQGVDLSIEFDTGQPVDSYTTGDGTVVAAGDKRQPRFITFAWPSYGLRPVRFAVDGNKANSLSFVFNPNDFGVVDLTGLVVETDKDGISLHRDGGIMHFNKGSD